MFCPNYKNKEVFNGFNEMIEAFGGKPMTEEEFRSADLRNERTGRDFAAMEAAYTVYDKNGGNFLDMAPNGNSSILFQTLLDHFGGDRNKAIVAKSNVYSDEFFNWFGDWTAENNEDVSKVVDSNGEPLVVWHTSVENFSEFNKTKAAYPKGYDELGYSPFFSEAEPTDRAFFFSTDVEYTKRFGRGSDTETSYPVYLNIKNEFNKQNLLESAKQKHPELDDADLEELSEQFYGWYDKEKYIMPDIFQLHTGYVAQAIGVARHYEMKIDGFIGKDVGETHKSTEFAVLEPNQVKHIENLGTWNPNTNNIYNIPATVTLKNTGQFDNASLSDFGTDVMSRLLNGETVTTDELVSHFIQTQSLSFDNMRLANILSRHNIPVKLDGTIGNLTLASTETNNITGNSIVLLNPNLVNKVSKGYLGEAILHEVVHAVTVSAINNPKTDIEKAFVRMNKKVFDVMSKAFPKHSALLNDIDLGLYALNNEKEFAAVFITDDTARQAFYSIARQLDIERNGKFISTIKNFINSILDLFVNKTLFNTNEALVKKYQEEFFKHLIGVPTQSSQKVSAKQLKELYDGMDAQTVEMQSVLDKMKFLNKYVEAVERNNINTVDLNGKTKDTTYSFDDITSKLQIRINALRTSDMKQSEKNKYINDTKTQIDMFVNQQTSKYIAITATLRQVIPQVLKDVRELQKINIDESQSITGREYMYQMHSNIGMYKQIASDLDGLLNQNSTADEIVEEFNRSVPEDQKITRNDLEEVKRSVGDLVQVTTEGESILKTLRDRTAKHILLSKAEKEGNVEDMQEYLNNITENPTFDDNISWFEASLGAMDSASNNALRALSSIVNRALKKADNAVIDKTVKLLELQAALKRGESVVDLYETDDKGFTSGYLIRKLNYGKFYKAYDNQLIHINKVISEVSNLKIAQDNRVAPNDDTVLTAEQVKKLNLKAFDKDGKEIEWTIRSAWNELKNDWLYQNCERKYNKTYYDAWNKVPQVAKDALDSINTEIASILAQPGVMQEDGYNHYDALSEEDWNTLQDLWIQKKLLRSDYDMFGNLKEEGSSEYKIAKALQQLNKDLYGEESQKIKKDTEAWQKAMDKEIERCGGKEAYLKWKAGEKRSGFKAKQFKQWHLRNSRLEFKKDSSDQAIIFKDIEDAMQGMQIDYGPEYNKLSEKANELLKPYRAQNGEVNAAELPDSVKNLLKEIYEQQYEIRQDVLSADKEKGGNLSELSKKYKEVFDQFITFVDTEYYKQIKKQIEKAATGEDGQIDLSVQDAMLEAYGNFITDDSGIEIGFKPYRWLQRMEALDVDKYMEYKPGDAWTEKVDNENLLNPHFDKNENCAFVPKKSLYDNSAKFAKIENSPTLKALYEEVVRTMHEANEMQSNRLYADDFLLPQETGTLWKRMKRHSAWGKTKVLFKYLFESAGVNNTGNKFVSSIAGATLGAGLGLLTGTLIGFPLTTAILGGVIGGYAGFKEKLGSINQEDYSQIGSTLALDESDSEGNVTVNNTPIRGKYPDGRSFHILPQYYTRKMEDPSQISSDLIRILSNYYKMSCYYKEKVAIKDDCETIVDFIEQRKLKASKTMFAKDGEEDKSRLFKSAEKFLEMNLYDMRRSSHVFKLGPIELQWSKTVSLWKTWTTRRNLGMNPKVALTGFLTSMGVHILNSITGQHYGKEGGIAFLESIRRCFQSACGTRYIGNPLSNDDMQVMAEVFDVAGQAERKWEGTHRNRLIQAAYKHSVFGFLSTADYISKTIIMTAILMNHHYVENPDGNGGRFMSREDVRNSRYLYNSKKEFQEAMKAWKKGPNLYSLLKAKEHRLTIDSKYRAAFEQQFDVIKDRVQKTAEYADGMATDLQRAAITQSVIGALVLIHKQYLPLIVQRYFGKRVYDYDTHQYKNGVFRTLFEFVGQIMQNNLMAGIGAGIFTGSAFGGVVGGGVGALAAIGVRAYGAYQHRNGKESKSLKQIWNEEFNDFSSKKSTAMSYANRYSMRDVVSTVVGYRLFVQPLVALVCSIADDDDDDKWWLQLLAYALRAFEWEYYTAFRTDDMLNNFKSPSAATSVLDAAEAVGYDMATKAPKMLVNTVSPQGNFLFDPSQSWDDFENIFGGQENVIEKGAYEGWTPWERDIVKSTAFHNLWEQLKNSKAKRRYQENQIMRLHKEKDEE